MCENECDAGSAERCRLAATYSLGEGTPQEDTRAAGLYECACDMKDPTACVFAGQMSECARGVPKDKPKAERACELS